MPMLFPTFSFAGFFAVVFAVYWRLPRQRWRHAWLLLASCVFYMTWNPYLILLILFSASVDYAAALAIERSPAPKLRKVLLVGSISINLGLLAFFKYANFFLDSAGKTLALFGVGWAHPVVAVLLPLGISFYTFETISYVTDVYRGRTRAVRNLLDYALFIMFFPHLVAGPIVRPHDFLPQLARGKRFHWDRMYLGARYLAAGLFKKCLLADNLATVADPVFAAPGSFASGAVRLAVLAYALQIYCDFSGYSDMAIGLAHMLGFRLPQNFNCPYLAVNPADFWRRWHISLSSWLRDYLYIPLGGNRAGAAKTYRNLLVVMALGGLWHGASWTFVVWGLYHGAWLALHRAVPLPGALGRPAFWPVRVAATCALTWVGWVFFRAQTLTDAFTVLTRLVVPTGGASAGATTAALVLACLAATFTGGLVGTFVRLSRVERRLAAPLAGAALAAVLLLAMVLAPENTRAFIYFQF
jgi:alginate O-acetyltransferase complex protein AlgI